MNEQMYIDLLEKELVPAMGCTEPIAIAFACAKAKEILNDEVVQVDIFASGSIIKNVKSVTVPNTEGKKGIQSAAAIGIVAGNPDLSLEVLSKVDKEQIKIMNEFMEQVPIKVHHLKTHCTLDIVVKLASKEHNCVLRIQDEHDNIVYVEKDEQVVKDYVEALNKLNIEPQFTQTFGGSDNNSLRQNGINGIVLASAMEKVHTVDEYCEISSLVKLLKIVLALAV